MEIETWFALRDQKRASGQMEQEIRTILRLYISLNCKRSNKIEMHFQILWAVNLILNFRYRVDITELIEKKTYKE